MPTEAIKREFNMTIASVHNKLSAPYGDHEYKTFYFCNWRY